MWRRAHTLLGSGGERQAQEDLSHHARRRHSSLTFRENGSKMKVLVTGHLGYIGTVMVPMLIGARHEVIGCDSNFYGRCSYQPGGEIVTVANIAKDIRDL